MDGADLQRRTLRCLSLKEAQVENRFEIFPDPFNNWIAWDMENDQVAEVGDQILQFLSEARARELCTVLNRQVPKIAA